MGLRAAIWAAALAMGAGVACAQQQPIGAGAGKSPDGTNELTQKNCSYGATAGGGKVTGTSNCTDTTPGAVPSPAQKFPYPGEAPEERKALQAGDAAPASGAAKGTAQKFPYPGEDGDKAEMPAADAPAPNSGDKPAPKPGDDNWSSSSSSGDNAGPPLNDAGSSGDETPVHQTRRRKLEKPEKIQTPDERESEDLDVAAYYQNDGNFKGAYDRAKDAIALKPDDPFGHFALAEAARRLGHKDEATSEYQAVLKLDAAPKEQKASKKALEELASGKR